MSLRTALVALIALATVGFVIGTTIERNSGESNRESNATPGAEPASSESHKGEGPGGGGEAAGGESGDESPATRAAETGELKPLGIDVEAVPFVAIAAVASLLIALAAWARPSSAALLLVIAAAMLAFGALDVGEVFHQHDESRTGLAILAGAVAALHLAAAAIAVAMAGRARPRAAGPASG